MLLVPPASPVPAQPAPDAQEMDFLPPPELDRPLWKSLLANLRDRMSPERLPPLQLTSRPVDVGMLLGDRMSLPWFRTIFTNLGDVISPEVLPPLQLESRPVEVGELIGDQLSHLWLSSLLRNLADRFVPETVPPLSVTSAPDDSVVSSKIMLLPRWSSVIDTPVVFLPDAPKPASTIPVPSQPPAPATPLPQPVVAEIEFLHVMENDLKRDLTRSRFRARVWIGIATAQVLFLLLSLFWPMLTELRH
jgi:hypothetical protein